MSSTLVDKKIGSSSVQTRPAHWSRWLTGHQGRRVREAGLAYLFLLPAFLIIATFGLFPLIFAAYQSTLRGLNQIVGTYDGLGNYVRAMDNLAYVLFFWVAAVLIYMSARALMRALATARERNEYVWKWSPGGIAIGLGIALLVAYIFHVLPLVLEVPNQIRQQPDVPGLFGRLLWQSLTTPLGLSMLGAALLLFVLAALHLARVGRGQKPGTKSYAGPFVGITTMLLLAATLSWLTWVDIRNAYVEALEAGEGLDIWTQIITISAGFLLLLIAWKLWDSAGERTSNIGLAFRLGAAATLLVGGWMLIGELPRAIASGDDDWWLGIQNTFYYSLGTIPLQLGISLALASLLFQDLKGKSLFRIIYFVPYIAPFVGTAAVFRIIFSSRPTGLINRVSSLIGGDPMQWLNEPTGIFQMMSGQNIDLPVWAAGPSLALVVIIIYGTWTFIGFNTVIFMAGLGNIPRELYEAASIDGGGRWAQFRSITLPLLSPTIYFLTLYSVIGTFKAFNHIYVLRTAAALGTTDTASIVIFQAFKRDTRYGYASALAILLLVIILILTAVNNRIASNRVFYG